MILFKLIKNSYRTIDIKDATIQLKRYETDDKFKKELLLAPYGDKKLIKLIVLFVAGELKILKRVE